MKQITSHPMINDIDYFGIKLTVPYWIKYIATDKNGYVHGYCERSKPELSADHWFIWESQGFTINKRLLAFADLDGMPWEETLIEVAK